MVSAINTALSGLTAAGRRFDVSAQNTANQLTPKYATQQAQQVSDPSGAVDVVVTSDAAAANSPEQNVVDQKLASYDFKANLKTLKVADDMQKSLLDIMG